MKTKNDQPMEPLQHMGPLIDDLLLLRDEISVTLKDASLPPGMRATEFFKSLYKGGKKKAGKGKTKAKKKGSDTRPLLTDSSEEGVNTHIGMEILLMGSFRPNVWISLSDDDSDKPAYIGWFHDPIRLWKERHEQLLTDLRQIFDETSGKSANKFLKSNVANGLMVPNWGESPSLPDPEIIYEIETGAGFIKSDTEPKFYWDGKKIRGIKEPPPPASRTTYRKK